MERMKKTSFIIRFTGIAYLVFLIWSLWNLTGRASGTGGVLGIFSIGWTYALASYYLIALVLIGFMIWLLIAPESFLCFLREDIEDILQPLRAGRWILVLAFIALPQFLLLGGWEQYFRLPVFRQVVFVTSGMIAGLMIPDRENRVGERLALGIFLTTLVYVVVLKAALVVDHPFSLSWSEGNRIWDYSLYFARGRYELDGDFSLPTYMAPGRHGLWGLIFLIPNVGIRAVRFWDLVIWIVPGILLGLTAFTRKHEPSPVRRWALVAWAFLFLWQGPIYSPLLLSAVLLLALYDKEDLPRSAAGAALACFYAGISRWTWFAAPAIWIVLLDLYHTDTARSWSAFWKRVQRELMLGGAGFLGGAVSWLVLQVTVEREDAIYSTALQQDLLFYRLWESATNELGILVGLLLAAGPLLLLIAWLHLRSDERRDWLFNAAALIALIAMSAVGLVASIKIGGGNNLHNLDMFLVTLVLLGMLVLPIWKKNLSKWPAVQLLTLLVILTPVWFATRSGRLPRFKEEELVQESLEIIREEVESAAGEGDVLFIDQRQLLTFGEVPRVTLVEEYELKDLMNQAMRRNETYFADFYEDLEAHRFSLIVSDPLPIVYKGKYHVFGEENDLWVEYVSEPVLENYEPIHKLRGVELWLLAPIEEQDDPR